MSAQNLETTLSKLVAIPSVSNNKSACQEIIDTTTSQLRQLGLFLEHSQPGDSNPWVLATTKQTKTPDILLMAHLDVVPGSQPLFQLKKENGKFFGRGVYDMKFAAVCYLELLRQHNKELQKKNIGILFTTDEEIGGPSIPTILALGLRPGIVFIPDGGDNWHIEKRAKGFYDVAITVHGKSAHGSRPWEGRNALHELLDILGRLRAAFPAGAQSDATLEVTQIRGGVAINQIPEQAEALIDFRTFSQNDINRYKQLLADIEREQSVEIEVRFSGSPLELDNTKPSVQRFLKVMREFTKKEPAYTESFGGSDGRFFAPLSIPVLIVEPRGGGRHSEDEWLDEADFLRFYTLLERWLVH